MEILKIIKSIIDYVAIILMVWGMILTILKIIINELNIKNGSLQMLRREQIRVYLGSYILLGLEIFIVADIIEIIIKPTLEDLTVLIIIVFVRTIISFFLGKEMKDASEDIKVLKDKESEVI